jgi:hypothetical protein
MDEQEEELESSWIFFFFALLPLALLFTLMFSPYLNQAHLPKHGLGTFVYCICFVTIGLQRVMEIYT